MVILVRGKRICLQDAGANSWYSQDVSSQGGAILIREFSWGHECAGCITLESFTLVMVCSIAGGEWKSWMQSKLTGKIEKTQREIN